ncbi:MAG: DNA-3-methyladenine glycosylase [Ignavibacteriaceae bacterium]|nr:DNA-3-methyladenine glycosylase [Ignavibacteriaceae bacterium]
MQHSELIKVIWGTELTGGKIFLLGNKKIAADKVGISKRIGITRSVNLPWRFFIINNPFLSRK